MEDKEKVLARVRNRLRAAKGRSGLSWQQIYVMCDEDGNGVLDFNELKNAVRSPEVTESGCRLTRSELVVEKQTNLRSWAGERL